MLRLPVYRIGIYYHVVFPSCYAISMLPLKGEAALRPGFLILMRYPVKNRRCLRQGAQERCIKKAGAIGPRNVYHNEAEC